MSQREWIYLKKIVSRETLMNWNIAMKCWNPKIIFSESIVIIQHALEKIQKTKRLSVNCKNMKIPLNERAKRTKKNRMTWKMKCWNPKIIFSESIVIIQHALEKIQKTKRLSVNCKNMKIPLNERAKRTKKNRMTWRLFKRDYGWWKCSFSTIRQILCQWNSPEEICTKCKNNPVSFRPKILHSQRGSTFFFYLLFSSDIPFIEDLQKIIIT